MGKKILVFDIGTQSMRCSIFNELGEVLNFCQHKYENVIIDELTNTCEVDIDFFIDTMASLSRELKSKDEKLFNQIDAITFTDIRDSCVILDENKKPLHNAILWLDSRRVKLEGKNFSFFNKLIFKLIGMWDIVIKNSERTFYQWLKVHNKELLKKIKYYIPLGAYFNYKITDNLVIATSDCVGHYPINFKKGKYYPPYHPMIEVFNIPLNTLPPLIKPGEIVGYINESFSKLSGLKKGLPLYATGSDKSCENLGNGAIDKNTCSISLGTACTVNVCEKKFKEIYPFLPSYIAPYEKAFNYELQVYSGFGLITKYAAEYVSDKEKEAAKKLNISIENYLDSQLINSTPGNNGLVLLPYWYPSLERPEAKGYIANFTFDHSKQNIYRAIIEGEAYCLLEGLEHIIKKTHKKPEKIVISGGGSASDNICQIFADIFNIKVVRNKQKESSSLGGAIAVLLALKEYNSPSEAVNKIVKYEKEFIPNLENHKKYNFVYKKIYKRLYKDNRKSQHYAKKFTQLFNN